MPIESDPDSPPISCLGEFAIERLIEVDRMGVRLSVSRDLQNWMTAAEAGQDSLWSMAFRFNALEGMYLRVRYDVMGSPGGSAIVRFRIRSGKAIPPGKTKPADEDHSETR